MAASAPKPLQADIDRGLASVQDHVAIEQARPRKRDVLSHFKGKPGVVHAKETPGGGIDVLLAATPDGLKRKREYLEMERRADALEVAHTDRIKATQAFTAVRDRAGMRKQIHAENEAGMGKVGLITTSARTFIAPAGVPRCQLEGRDHDYRGGRCWWCGKEA